eukprot:5555233-Prymnesium_polylepis.1
MAARARGVSAGPPILGATKSARGQLSGQKTNAASSPSRGTIQKISSGRRKATPTFTLSPACKEAGSRARHLSPHDETACAKRFVRRRTPWSPRTAAAAAVPAKKRPPNALEKATRVRNPPAPR